MSVQELIELLQQEDPSKKVYRRDGDGNLCEVETATMLLKSDQYEDTYVIVID